MIICNLQVLKKRNVTWTAPWACRRAASDSVFLTKPQLSIIILAKTLLPTRHCGNLARHCASQSIARLQDDNFLCYYLSIRHPNFYKIASCRHIFCWNYIVVIALLHFENHTAKQVAKFYASNVLACNVYAFAGRIWINWQYNIFILVHFHLVAGIYIYVLVYGLGVAVEIGEGDCKLLITRMGRCSNIIVLGDYILNCCIL